MSKDKAKKLKALLKVKGFHPTFVDHTLVIQIENNQFPVLMVTLPLDEVDSGKTFFDKPDFIPMAQVAGMFWVLWYAEGVEIAA